MEELGREGRKKEWVWGLNFYPKPFLSGPLSLAFYTTHMKQFFYCSRPMENIFSRSYLEKTLNAINVSESIIPLTFNI